jgi:hypothetical protein
MISMGGYAGARVRGYGYADAGTRVNGYGYNGFFPKKHCPALLKPVPVYPFIRLYPGMGTDTAGTDGGYTDTGCTRRVLANHYAHILQILYYFLYEKFDMTLRLTSYINAT